MGIILAFAPFAAVLLAEHFWGTLPSLLVGAGVAFALLARERLRHKRAPKILEVGAFVLFAGLAAQTALTKTTWSAMGIRTTIDAGLLAIVLVSLALRRPFTLQYAREQVPSELWNQPRFVATNYVITTVWAGAFALILAADVLVLCSPALSVRLTLVVSVVAVAGAALFTDRYPRRVLARRAQR